MKRIQDKFSVTAHTDEAGTFNIQPRASVRVTSVTKNSMTWKVSSLSYPAKNYDKFEIEVYGGGSTKYKTWTSRNSSYDTSVTVTGLKPDTKYKGTITASYKGKWYTCGSDYDYTDPEPVTPPTLNSINISNVTTNSFYYSIRHTLGDYFNVEVIERSSGSVVYERNKTNYSYGTVTGLKPSTEYKINVSVFNDGGRDYDYKFVTTATPPKLPDPNVTITPSVSSVTFSWSRPTGASVLVCTIRNEATNISQTRNFDAYSSPQTITGLSPRQSYRVYFRYEPSSANSSLYSPSNVFTTHFTTDPKPTFYWSTAPVSGRPFSISASDWCKLQDTTNEWRKLKGLSTYSFSRPSSGTKFSASYFNEVRSALSSISGISGLPSSVSRGGKCYASSFVALQTAINNLNI